jgi:hypothetical protein
MASLLTALVFLLLPPGSGPLLTTSLGGESMFSRTISYIKYSFRRIPRADIFIVALTGIGILSIFGVAALILLLRAL